MGFDSIFAFNNFDFSTTKCLNMMDRVYEWQALFAIATSNMLKDTQIEIDHLS